MPQKSYFSPKENERLRTLAARLLRDGRFTSQSQLAKTLGVQQPSLSHMLGGRYGFGPKTAERLCALEGVSLNEFLGRTQLLEPEYPNRMRVVRLAREIDLPESAVKSLEAIRIRTGKDRPAAWWLTRLAAYCELVGDHDVDDPAFVR